MMCTTTRPWQVGSPEIASLNSTATSTSLITVLFLSLVHLSMTNLVKFAAVYEPGKQSVLMRP